MVDRIKRKIKQIFCKHNYIDCFTEDKDYLKYSLSEYSLQNM